ncbi:hypothetical protein Pst134EB_001829 [Puccinia striiformis f. sp. tritici]|nr:hypothetical protein Pst134EB_001829 [Puccinia striiformis f. sp. tritici]
MVTRNEDNDIRRNRNISGNIRSSRSHRIWEYTTSRNRRGSQHVSIDIRSLMGPTCMDCPFDLTRNYHFISTMACQYRIRSH